jgi:ribonucleoside-diphosphate reductase alpha chain
MPELQTSLLEEPELKAEPVVIEEAAPKKVAEDKPAEPAPRAEAPKAPKKDDTAPMCYNCGNQTQKAGSCYVCTACGSTTGCS